MRARVVIVSVLAALTLLVVAIGIVAGVFIGRFDAIELSQTAERAAQVARALETDLNQLSVSTRDYAEWDDAQAYAVDRDPAFLRANFSIDSLAGMHVDAIAILASDGSEMYSALLDEQQGRLISPAPSDLVDRFRRLQPQEPALRLRDSARRILNTPDGPLAFSMLGIRRSDKSGATGAVMVFARYLRADEIERLRQTSKLPARLTMIDAPLDTQQSLPENVQAWRRGSLGTAATDALAINARQVVGYALLRDIDGKPLAYLVTDHERDVGMLGRHTTWSLMGVLAALLCACSLALTLMMMRLRQSWAARAALESRHRNILTHLGESVVLADLATGQIVDANDALLRMLGYSRSELPLLTLRNIYVDLPETLAGGSAAMERRLRARDGRLIEEEVTVTNVVEDERRMICIVGRDVSQRKQAEQALRENQSRMRHLAEHDALTDLPNGYYLQACLPTLLQELAASRRSLTLAYIDIDHFKNVNDSRGHGLGDAVLKVMAHRLSIATSAEQTVLRMGGDEFVILAPDIDGDAALREFIEQLLEAIRAPVILDDVQLSFTASSGVAIYPRDGTDSETLLKHADTALHAAKNHGRDCYRLFSSEMNVQLSEHLVLEQALRQAIDTDQIFVEYQPVVDLQTGLLVSFEALARWRHPQLGSVSPGRFIPVAEKSGLIIALTERIVRNVVMQLSAWRDAGLLLAPVAVNVAPVQFERTNFSTFVHETALQYDIEPRWLSFEVTESAWMQNSSKHIVMMDTLRHEGSRVYIDDFGTGFSNLSYLKTLPVDAVKIDQAFIRGIETDASDEAIVSGIVAMSRQLNLATVAEGIETAAQAERLRDMGCNYGQGYYFSRPMPAQRCQALLQQLAAARQLTQTITMRAFRKAAAG